MASHSFPPNFLIGCASASYQVEGGWNADGNYENKQLVNMKHHSTFQNHVM